MIGFELHGNRIPVFSLPNLGDENPEVVTRELGNNMSHLEGLVGNVKSPLVLVKIQSQVEGAMSQVTLSLFGPFIQALTSRDVTVLFQLPASWDFYVVAGGGNTIMDEAIPLYGRVDRTVVDAIVRKMSGLS